MLRRTALGEVAGVVGAVDVVSGLGEVSWELNFGDDGGYAHDPRLVGGGSWLVVGGEGDCEG